MKQNDLRPSPGSRKHGRRVGRGNSSGRGTYSGRGCKGQKSRAGGGVRPSFEGGQLPLVKRLPEKRGFVNIFKLEYNVVNVGDLNVFPQDSEVGSKELRQAGIIKSLRLPTKILGDGSLDHGIMVKADKFSVVAERKILAAGGQAQRI